jgi:hypothetical protein
MSHIPQDDKRRKGAPMYRGLLGYFPAALFEVAEHSRESNDKHNPGEEIHWARGKSADHEDCIVRHLIDASKKGKKGRKYHLRALAWRALAMLQEECEAEGAEPGVSSVFPEEQPAQPERGFGVFFIKTKERSQEFPFVYESREAALEDIPQRLWHEYEIRGVP